MNIKNKNNNIKLLSVFLVCAAIFIFLLHIGLFSSFFTEYSEEFTYKKFKTTFAGQKKQEVYAILGRPFSDSSSGLMSCDWYSRPSKFGGKLSFTDFAGWISVRVCYDKNNVVIDTPQNTFFN